MRIAILKALRSSLGVVFAHVGNTVVARSESACMEVVMGRLLGPIVVVVFSLAIAATAFAQASVTGTVRDTSGAVLPG